MCLGVLVSPVLSGQVIQVADINPGPGGGGAGGLTVYDGDLYFSANDLAGGNNTELWRYDGATTTLAAEIRPGTSGSSPSGLTVYNDKLYFAARGASGPTRLYQYDGASASVVSTEFQGPEEFTLFDGKLFFRGTDFAIPKTGTELWKISGAGPPVLIDLVPGAGTSLPKQFVEYGGSLYFNSRQELWKLNAAASGATQVTDIANGQGSSPEHPVVFNNDIYFSAYDHVNGRELWRYNGGAPVMVADIKPGGQYDSGNPSGMTVYNDAIYFTADNGVHGAELWRHDGAVTEMVANINATAPPSGGEDPEHHAWPMDFFVFGGLLYFAADDGIHGRELWSCNGETVSLVADIYPGRYGSSVGGFAVYNERLYFSANNGQLGGELHTYNDAAGLFLLTAPPQPGDTNNDRIVDSEDYNNLVAQFGGPPGLASADFNLDDIVDLEDFAILRDNFGFGLASAPDIAPGATAPLPATLVLLVGGLPLLLKRKRHKQ
jgi:ELWxxDGT repeat protein